jgi:putative flippase GtrA
MSINNVRVMRAARSKKGRSMIKFAVGGTSIAINTLVLFLLSQEAGLSLAVASALAVELAAVGSYLLIERCMFAGRMHTFRRFAKFNVASLMGLALNVFVVWFLARLGLYFLAANLMGIAAGFTINRAFGVSYMWGGAA